MNVETEALYERIWQTDVRDRFFSQVQPSEHPVLISVGGQPGAGKTLSGKAAESMYPQEKFVAIDGDVLRQTHPNYEQLVKNPDPKVMPAETADISGWMVRRSLSYAAENGYSVRVEGTFRKPETTLGTIHDFHDHGFETHVVAVGVTAAVSWQGCVSRYVDALDMGKPARWAPKSAHDAGFAGTPLTVGATEADPAVSRLSVISRTGEITYDNTRDESGQWRNPRRDNRLCKICGVVPVRPFCNNSGELRLVWTNKHND